MVNSKTSKLTFSSSENGVTNATPEPIKGTFFIPILLKLPKKGALDPFRSNAPRRSAYI